jgi:hypothetical protein
VPVVFGCLADRTERALLFAPFTPLFVIFSHSMNVLQNSDLVLLEDFIASIQPCCAASEGIQKLWSLAQVLHSIASSYIRIKMSCLEDLDPTPLETGFDRYLERLGLVPQQDRGLNLEGAGSVALTEGAQLGDWFAGNISLSSLLEDDLSNFLNNSGDSGFTPR